MVITIVWCPGRHCREISFGESALPAKIVSSRNALLKRSREQIYGKMYDRLMPHSLPHQNMFCVYFARSRCVRCVFCLCIMFAMCLRFCDWSEHNILFQFRYVSLLCCVSDDIGDRQEKCVSLHLGYFHTFPNISLYFCSTSLTFDALPILSALSTQNMSRSPLLYVYVCQFGKDKTPKKWKWNAKATEEKAVLILHHPRCSPYPTLPAVMNGQRHLFRQALSIYIFFVSHNTLFKIMRV